MATTADLEKLLASTQFELLLANYRQLVADADVFTRARASGSPIVFISDVHGEETAVAAMQAGAVDYLLADNLDHLPSAVLRATQTDGERHTPRREEDCDDLQDEFISRLSHDLRTPLAAIKASIGVVLAHEPPGTTEPIHRLFKNIDFAADQMEELVANLTELARIQAHRFALRPEACDLADVARGAATAIGALMERRQQQLAVELPDAPIPAHVDAARLQRCLVNVLGNAHKYGREGGTVHLQLEPSGDTAVFTVSNDGPPVAEADRERLLTSLRLSPNDPTVPSQKTGLGLQIARAIVEQHGGRISVETPPDAGAIVRIALPVPAPSPVTAQPA